MSQVISTKKSNFKIYNEFDTYNLSDPYYLVEILVKELKYENENYYYDLTYNYKFISSIERSEEYNYKLKLSLHPFYDKKHCECTGVIVFKNEMITKMIEYLLMSDSDLKSISGLTTTQNYRVNIMNSLEIFWD